MLKWGIFDLELFQLKVSECMVTVDCVGFVSTVCGGEETEQVASCELQIS